MNRRERRAARSSANSSSETAEALCTAGVWALLGALAVPDAVRAAAAAVAGVALAVTLLNRDPAGPLAEAKTVLAQARRRTAAPAG